MQLVSLLIICNCKAFPPLLILGILMHTPSVKVVSFLSTLNEVSKYGSCHTVNFLCIWIRRFALFSASSVEMPLFKVGLG